MKNLRKIAWAVVPLSLCFGGVLAEDSVTIYKYDARGRLIKVTDNASREVNYEYDDAGNRISVADETAPPAPPPASPLITSFIAPSSVNSGSFAIISWGSTDTTHCELSVFGGQLYTNLATTSFKSIYLTETTAVTLTCFNGENSDTAGKIIQVREGGGGFGFN